MLLKQQRDNPTTDFGSFRWALVCLDPPDKSHTKEVMILLKIEHSVSVRNVLCVFQWKGQGIRGKGTILLDERSSLRPTACCCFNSKENITLILLKKGCSILKPCYLTVLNGLLKLTSKIEVMYSYWVNSGEKNIKIFRLIVNISNPVSVQSVSLQWFINFVARQKLTNSSFNQLINYFSRGILDEMEVTQLFNKFPIFYGVRKLVYTPLIRKL